MKDLTFDDFAGGGVQKMMRILHEATIGDEIYRVNVGDAGRFVIMSEGEYNIHHEALRLLIENAKDIPSDWLKNIKPQKE